uniref:CD86 antigen n=1 Tax=Cricetulus griseus TaxID=10029 RepID=A0A8C2QMZ0_CRIGR
TFPSCSFGFSILDAVSMKTQAYFNRTAYLPCPFTKAQNISLSELVVFWQDHKKSVLYEHYLGKEKLDNVNAKYLGRTSFDGDNWTLGLHSVQIKDMGTYDCFIQKKTPKGSVILQQTETDLSVIANFSEPEIEFQNITRISGINLTCSSKEGYPKPTKMYILVTNSTNSTNEHSGDMEISQDNVTELFSVFISLSVPFPNGVSSVTTRCVLEIESMKIFSRPHNIEFQSVQKEMKAWIAGVIIIVAVLGVIASGLFYLYCRKPEQPGIS